MWFKGVLLNGHFCFTSFMHTCHWQKAIMYHKLPTYETVYTATVHQTICDCRLEDYQYIYFIKQQQQQQPLTAFVPGQPG